MKWVLNHFGKLLCKLQGNNPKFSKIITKVDNSKVWALYMLITVHINRQL